MVTVMACVLVSGLVVGPASARGGSGWGGGGTAGTVVSLLGPIEALPTSGLVGDWTVGGKTVHVTDATMVNQMAAPAAVGATVEVQGTLQSDGSIDALHLEVIPSRPPGPPTARPATLVGLIDALPASGLIGDWTVRGVTVHVTSTTTVDQTDGSIAVGTAVLVHGTLQTDGSIDASSVEALKQPGTPPKNVSFCGLIKSLPASGLIGDWTVDTVTVHVDASTTIDQSKGTPAANTPVRVSGVLQTDGSVNATEIVVNPTGCGSFKQPASMTFSVLHLTATSDAPAGGEGVVLTRRMTFPDGSTREDLKVAVEHLLPNTAYEVMIDTIDAGPIMTNDTGEGMLFLSTADIPGAEPLPTDLQDFSTLVQVDVNESSGTTVLTGKFADAKTSDHEGGGLAYLGVAVVKDSAAQVVGMAAASIKGTLQELSLSVWGLMPGQKYTLVVDTTTVGDLTASARGRIQAEYSSAPTGEDLQLPDALVPVSSLMHLELQDSGGTAVASGDFQKVANPIAPVVARTVQRSLHH
jgi:hypothetical protein